MLLVAGRDWLQSHCPGTRAIVAEVLPANEASVPVPSLPRVIGRVIVVFVMTLSMTA